MASGPIGGSRQDPDPLAPLWRWAAEDRVEQARRRRRRQESLTTQAGEAGTWRAVLIDLAERGDRVVLLTRVGVVRGAISVVGEDFCGIHAPDRVWLLAFPAVVSVQSEARLPMGFRATTAAWTMAEALAELAHDRPQVKVHAAATSVVAGRLLRAGPDVVTVAADRRAARPISFNLAVVDAVTLWRRGRRTAPAR